MKNQKKILIEAFILSLSVLISSYIWKYISINYIETDIIGNYSKNNYNQNNDLLRYLFFIIFPLIVFLTIRFLDDKNLGRNFLYNLKKIKEANNKDFYLNFLLAIFIFFIFLEFFSINFVSTSVDVYHDGQRMSSAFRSYLDNSLWSKSFVITGIFHETLATKFSWIFFNIVSIGSAKFALTFLILINKILLTFFSFQISKNSDLKIISRSLFFLCNFLIFQSLIDYKPGNGDILNYRDLSTLLLLIIFPYIIIKKKISYLFIFFIGIFSLPALFWSLDRGIIYNILIFLIIFYLFLVNYISRAILLLSSILLSWLIFSYMLGSEFNHFLSNSLIIFREINFIHGIIHPIPFSGEQNSTRATKVLLTIILSIFVSLSLFLKSNRKYNYYLKSILLLISACCVLSYLTAIGRSDGPHIKNAFVFPAIFFAIFILFNFFKFFENKIEKKFFSLNKTRLLISFLIIIVFSFNFEINIKNISNFKNRLHTYVNLDDSEFITEDYSLFISKTNQIFEKEECVQLFTNNAILYYFIRKKSCTKYYFVWAVGSKMVQDDFVKELKNTKFIITDNNELENDFSPSYRLPHVKRYIDKNYNEFLSSYKFKIYKKK